MELVLFAPAALFINQFEASLAYSTFVLGCAYLAVFGAWSALIPYEQLARLTFDAQSVAYGG